MSLRSGVVPAARELPVRRTQAIRSLSQMAYTDMREAKDVRLVKFVAVGAHKSVDCRSHLCRWSRQASGDSLHDSHVEANAGRPVLVDVVPRGFEERPSGRPGRPAWEPVRPMERRERGTAATKLRRRGRRSCTRALSRATTVCWFSNPQ